MLWVSTISYHKMWLKVHYHYDINTTMAQLHTSHSLHIRFCYVFGLCLPRSVQPDRQLLPVGVRMVQSIILSCLSNKSITTAELLTEESGPGKWHYGVAMNLLPVSSDGSEDFSEDVWVEGWIWGEVYTATIIQAFQRGVWLGLNKSHTLAVYR